MRSCFILRGKEDTVKPENEDLFHRALVFRSRILRMLGRPEGASKDTDRAFSHARRVGDKEFLASCYLLSCELYFSRGKFRESIKEGIKGLKIASENGFEGTEASIMSDLAVGYRNIRDYDKAMEYNLKVLEIRKKERNLKEQTLTMSNIGIALVLSGKLDEALKYLNDALSIARKINDAHALSYLHSHIGYINLLMKKYAKGLGHYKRSNKMIKACGDKYLLMGNYSRLALHYLGQKDWKSARHYFALSDKIAVETESIPGQAKVAYGLGKLSLNENRNMPGALKYFETSLELFTKCGDPYFTGIVHKELYRCYLEMNDEKRAHRHIIASIRDFIKIKRYNDIQTLLQETSEMFKKHDKKDLQRKISRAIRRELEKIDDAEARAMLSSLSKSEV